MSCKDGLWIMIGWIDPYIKILIMSHVIYESAHKKHINVVVAVWSVSNSFKKLMFWLINSPLPNYIYFISGAFLTQTRAAYCATMISSLRAIKRKPNEMILEMHKILLLWLLFFNCSIKIVNYYIVISLKIWWDIFILLKQMMAWLGCLK